jgi:hypothetical protein
LFSLIVIRVWKANRQRGYLDGHWAAYFWSSSRLTLWPDRRRATVQAPSCGGVMSKTNEWNLLRHRFDELAQDESAGGESIEEIFDVQFRRRFAELINQTAERNSTTFYIDWSRR